MHLPIRSSVDRTALLQIDAEALGQKYVSNRRASVYDLNGALVAEMAVSPPVYIHKTINLMRHGTPRSLDEIHAAMACAADSIQFHKIEGLSPQEYCGLVQRTTGLPESVIQNSLVMIADALRNMPQIINAGKPQGARWNWLNVDSLNGCSLFSRKGEIFVVLAAGNGPGIHALWPQALAMGYRTVIRPSTREPFTAQRVVTAIAQAGLEEYVALIPTDYRGADELIASADLALAYGGQEIVDKYRDQPNVLVQGPGRAKIVIGSDACLDEAASLVAASMTNLGGAACVSTSAVLVEGDVSDFCKRLRKVLKQVSIDTLPRTSEKTITWLNSVLDSPVEVISVNDGYVLRPVLTEVSEPDDPRIQREFPIPCVTVAPYQESRSAAMLSGSLVVTVLSRKANLLSPVLADSSISNIYVGDIPTTWMSHTVPHDAYLSDFLMCNRGLRVSASWTDTAKFGE